MSEAILHSINVQASQEEVFRRLTTQLGLASWWTPSVDVGLSVGSISSFGFRGGMTIIRMRVNTLIPSHTVEWECIGGIPEWEGTRLMWSISGEKGSCRVDFSHEGWASHSPTFRICNTDWGRLMYALKHATEEDLSCPFME